MKKAKSLADLAIAVLLLCSASWTHPAFAYRPFDSTDASVADDGEFELELGPVHLLREGATRSFLAPAAIANFGISGDREIVLEGKLKTLQDTPSQGARTSLVDTALSLKQVHRRGSLQDGAGVSVASECGVLLPTIRAEHGVGATCAGIVSQRWSAMTLHINAALTRTRERTWNRFLGGIVEGPYEWPVRPVFEAVRERDTAGSRTRSNLIGAIWRVQKDLSLDLGLRTARSDNQNISELRAGFTWAF